MLVMVSSQLADGLADELVVAFGEVMSGEALATDGDVASLLTGEIFKKG